MRPTPCLRVGCTGNLYIFELSCLAAIEAASRGQRRRAAVQRAGDELPSTAAGREGCGAAVAAAPCVWSPRWQQQRAYRALQRRLPALPGSTAGPREQRLLCFLLLPLLLQLLLPLLPVLLLGQVVSGQEHAGAF
eukprot:COSAG01_NODE_1257_length_11020_cov_5.619723_3_plen_135_part_00